MIEPKLIRYLHASLADLLKPVGDNLGLKFFIEGVNAELEEWFVNDSMLLRINGPWLREFQGETYHRVEVLVMLTDLMEKNENPYSMFDQAGIIAETLSAAIPIYRHGDGGELIGCLQQDRDSRDFVRVVQYGQIEKDTKVRQMAVIGRYELTI